jgi:glycosyltransferase involved in cell wall biosynthesis
VTAIMKKPSVCVVTIPTLAFNERVGVDNFIRLLQPSSENLLVITGDCLSKSYPTNVRLKPIRSFKVSSLLSRLFSKLVDPLRVTLRIIKCSRDFEIACFHVGVGFNQLAIITAKILRKKIVIYQFGGNFLFEQRLMAVKLWEKIAKPMNAVLSNISYPLADVIICEGGKHLMHWDQLDRYEKKIATFVARDVDLCRFDITSSVGNRPLIVGYFGRLDPKKGIFNFVQAIPLVLEKCSDVTFVIAGKGPLKQKIEKELNALRITDSVKFSGFIDDDSLVSFFNSLKVLVIPTYDDGIPEVLKEAMACGTIVACTPVGGIPDVIVDKVNAFLIHRNDAVGVAEAILSALNYSDLNQVSYQGRKFIERLYAHDTMVERYKQMLEKATAVRK